MSRNWLHTPDCKSLCKTSLFLAAGCEQLRLRHWAVPVSGAPAVGTWQPVQLPPLPPHQVLLLQKHLLRLCPLLLPVLQRLQWAGSGG